MFETVDSAEVMMPSILLPEGKHAWSNVSLRIHILWFYVVYRIKYEDDTELTNVIFLTTAEQINEMVFVEKCQLLDVYLVSPGYINGTNNWKMEKIKQVWEATIQCDELDTRGRIYILEDNSEYKHSYQTIENDEITKRKLILEV